MASAVRRRGARTTAEGNEGLAYLLEKRVAQIGPETALETDDPSVVVLVSPHGSYRFVGFDRERAVSALQVMSRDGLRAVIANVYTAPTSRRSGMGAAPPRGGSSTIRERGALGGPQQRRTRVAGVGARSRRLT